MMTTKTAERLNSMSLMEIFDFVNEAITKQGAPSYDEKLGDCAYRGPNGLKCAAGMLVDDEDYTPELEGLGARDMCKKVGFLIGDGQDDLDYADTITRKRDLLARLQSAHDNAARDVREPLPHQVKLTFVKVYAEKMEHVRTWLTSLSQSR